MTPTAPSYLDSDLDADSDTGDVTRRRQDRRGKWITITVVDINQFVAMADQGQAQAPADSGGQPPTAQASEISSKDGWLTPMKFSGTSSEDAQLWWCSFELFMNFKELTDQRALAIFPLMLKDGAMTWYLGQSAATETNWTTLQDAFKERYFPQEINKWNRHHRYGQ